MSKIEKVELENGVNVYVYKARRGYMCRNVNGKFVLGRAKLGKSGWKASHLATFATLAEGDKAAQEKARQHLAMVGTRKKAEPKAKAEKAPKVKAPKAKPALPATLGQEVKKAS